jgi:hypothetical protein
MPIYQLRVKQGKTFIHLKLAGEHERPDVWHPRLGKIVAHNKDDARERIMNHVMNALDSWRDA